MGHTQSRETSNLDDGLTRVSWAWIGSKDRKSRVSATRQVRSATYKTELRHPCPGYQQVPGGTNRRDGEGAISASARWFHRRRASPMSGQLASNHPSSAVSGSSRDRPRSVS